MWKIVEYDFILCFFVYSWAHFYILLGVPGLSSGVKVYFLTSPIAQNPVTGIIDRVGVARRQGVLRRSYLT